MWRKKVALGELWVFLIVLVSPIDADRFLKQSKASQFLTRHRRANSLFEESKEGNLERECIEELCNKEEAREVFENTPETENFYPRYVLCLGSHRVGTQGSRPIIPSDLRVCVKEISNQCLPFPCYKEGTDKCVDGKATFRCVCKLGWKGSRCEEDIDECSDPDFLAGCAQQCYNFPGGFRCACADGYTINDITNCIDVNECIMYPSICAEPAKCVNTPGLYECQCPPGFKYIFNSKTCKDVDECEMNVCGGTCQNTQGSYACHCDGREGLRLAKDGHVCEQMPLCLPLYDHKHPEMLYLGEQFTGLPMIFLRYRLSENTKFAAEFDFRTFDPEGVVLYAESTQDAWFMLGLRDGRIEVQFKNQHTFKVTSGGKAINDGQWHVISVDELDNSISVKISNEAVMSINSPESLFMSVNGKLETKVYIAGLPNRTDIIKLMNPRLDGCIRGWNLMNQGASGVKEVIQEKTSKHCFVDVERGSYFTGAGLATFNIDYSERGSVDWRVDVRMNVRPSRTTGVLFALVYNNTLPLSLSVVKGESEDDAKLQVLLDGVPVATLESIMLCYPGPLAVELTVTPTEVLMSGNSSTVYYTQAMEEALDRLNSTMQNPVSTYIGGIPAEVPVSTAPVTAYYHGCMDVTINGQQLDFDEALSKHNSIKSHSCPPLLAPETHPDIPSPHWK